MSRENLENLLDAMLEESATTMEADATREREERERKERETQASVLRARAKEEPAAPVFDQIPALTGLTDGDLRKVLAKAPPDELIVVLATSDDALQRRILGNLGPESVAWVRENLAHIERVTNAEREGAHKKVLKAANALLAAGEIALPEPESSGSDAAPNAIDEDLRDLLSDLVRIASQAGPEALTEVLASAGEPLLEEGLALVARGASGGELRSALATRKAALQADYARRLGWMEDAIFAIAEGEPAEHFRKRLFES